MSSLKACDFHQIWFTGHVQGVGFRYKTSQIAREFEVRGQVENLTDGRVFLQIEGERSELEAFVEEIQLQMESFIRETELRRSERPASFEGFRIA